MRRPGRAARNTSNAHAGFNEVAFAVISFFAKLREASVVYGFYAHVQFRRRFIIAAAQRAQDRNVGSRSEISALRDIASRAQDKRGCRKRTGKVAHDVKAAVELLKNSYELERVAVVPFQADYVVQTGEALDEFPVHIEARGPRRVIRCDAERDGVADGAVILEDVIGGSREIIWRLHL